MTQAVADILHAVEQLTEEEKQELSGRLYAVLPAEEEWEISDAQIAEVRRRAEELDSGRVKGIPIEEVFEEAERIVNGSEVAS
jgi:putative addiction module component (TIGR02574 family)